MKITSLNQQTSKPNTHNPKIMKRVLIENGQIPHLTNLTQAIFPPGEIANEHTHQDMYEVFFIEDGIGEFKINGKTVTVKSGDCITVEPGDAHEIKNPGLKGLVITYMGIEVD